ncbi:lipase family protein [Neomicrococcus lactis]|uniref:Pimeloyl-ACP methyl ester carboxylesterase n=1 Tax=Neomicrococcus lactis TaxID=732241 RepID=A0A7W8YAK4_9MICC|nr:lipase family protein [Neomicrococcus lactis]MBB5597932.1 pimeloyl-ACP methyl ester carboxylesterase [Neomicrococcus lactis]
MKVEPFESGGLRVMPQVIDQGWALVATDYTGLGTPGLHPYLMGPESARAELDAVRAARQLQDLKLSNKTVSWGHSQGGGSALWTGKIAPTYAPDVPLSGVAAMAPASDLKALIGSLSGITGDSVVASFAIMAFTEIYPDVTFHEYVRPGFEPFIRSMAERCLASPDLLVSLLDAVSMSRDPQIFYRDPLAGALGERLNQN